MKKEKTCFQCKRLQIKISPIGVRYLCEGIVLADEEDDFIPKQNCKKFIPKERKNEKNN